MVERIVREGNAYWCVLHGHPQKAGSETDKPIGSVIKCYSVKQFGEEGAKKKAESMHQAILISESEGK